MEGKVLDFIQFLNANIKERPQCFMLALLLKSKFSEARLYYNSDHFITLIDGKYYDWDGIATKINHLPFEDFGDNWVIIHYNAIVDRLKKVLI